jgi:putative ABC transport system permease protein
MHFWHDLVFAFRSLRKAPGLVLVVTLSLGLGIGVNTTIFNLFNQFVLAKPTAVEPDRLVRIEPGNGNNISYPNFVDVSANRAFDGMLVTSGAALNWRTGENIRMLQGLAVSANFFEMLGNHAWRGRTFDGRENGPGRDTQVAVLGYDFWQNRLQADDSIVGRSLTLNGRPFTVVGVMARSYRPVMASPLVPDIFVPIGPAVISDLDDRGRHGFLLVARLARGTNRRQAQAAFTSMAQGLEASFPAKNRDFGKPAWLGGVYGLESMGGRRANPALFVGISIPFVIVGILLLIACANVAGVMLARGAMRQREIAVRMALGAGRSRVVQALMAESLLLSLLSAAGGLLLTSWLTPLISQVRLPQTPALPAFDLHMDASMAVYSLAIALGACMLSGFLPARQSTKLDILPWLKQSSAQGGQGRGRLRRWLVTGQVTASVVLLMVCVLFLRSLLYVGAIDPGFDIDHGITAQITPERQFSPDLHTYAEEAARRVAALPGVRSVSYASLIPLGGDSVAGGVSLKERADWHSPLIQMANVGPRYFQTMGIRLLQGREFGLEDREGAPPVVVVNQAFVRQCFPAGDALGKLVKLEMGPQEPWREIVGIVADSKYAFYAEDPQPQAFSPFLQTGGRLFLVARTAGAPSALVNPVTRTLLEMDKSAVADVKTTRQAASLEFELRRLGTTLLAFMGSLGLLLAMIGLYGVLSWEVSRRTSEIGVRMALGASHGAVRRMVLRDSFRVVGAGLATGLALAVVLTIPLRSFLAGVGAADPVAMAGVTVILLLVGLAATWYPVRRATRVDPLTALRYE